jgi:cholesterol oxidase
MDNTKHDYDYVIIGSGFGGSVSAYRLSQKGYKVLVIERGKWFKADDFPKTNWNFKRFFWMPKLKLNGILKLTFFRHITVLSGSGVGGGSLVYCATLPVPKSKFFKKGSWKDLDDWEETLKPFYTKAKVMLGRATNTTLKASDEDFRILAKELDIEDKFRPTEVGIFMGEAGKTVADPFFNGEGPERTGCTHCGACMSGCRNNSKNSLDKNYIYLSQKLGAEIQAERHVYDVKPIDNDGTLGYTISHKSSTQLLDFKTKTITAANVIFAGGAIGTNKLLLQLKTNKSLSNLSERLGKQIRTNNEALCVVTTPDDSLDRSEGVSIGSIIDIDEDTHIESTRWGAGSSALRVGMLPMINGDNIFIRLYNLFKDWCKSPILNFKTQFVRNWSERTNIILFMQTIDSTLQFKLNKLGMMVSDVEEGKPPTPFLPLAQKLSHKLARIMKGKSFGWATEALFGIPTTAHILGGATMGDSIETGVVDKHNRVFGYKNMLICDGSTLSSNPGVNPSLTITAITEHAMSHIPEKSQI